MSERMREINMEGEKTEEKQIGWLTDQSEACCPLPQHPDTVEWVGHETIGNTLRILFHCRGKGADNPHDIALVFTLDRGRVLAHVEGVLSGNRNPETGDRVAGVGEPGPDEEQVVSHEPLVKEEGE